MFEKLLFTTGSGCFEIESSKVEMSTASEVLNLSGMFAFEGVSESTLNSERSTDSVSPREIFLAAEGSFGSFIGVTDNSSST